jgi:hypothetical protein
MEAPASTPTQHAGTCAGGHGGRAAGRAVDDRPATAVLLDLQREGPTQRDSAGIPPTVHGASLALPWDGGHRLVGDPTPEGLISGRRGPGQPWGWAGWGGDAPSTAGHPADHGKQAQKVAAVRQ